MHLEDPIVTISQPDELTDKLYEIGVQFSMIAYALLVLNLKRVNGIFVHHSQVRTSDTLQGAAYHFWLAKFVAKVCIDEKLSLLDSEATSNDLADTETPAEELMRLSLGNFHMFGQKYAKLCSQHFGIQCTDPGVDESKPEYEDEQNADQAKELSIDDSKEEESTWEDEAGVL